MRWQLLLGMLLVLLVLILAACALALGDRAQATVIVNDTRLQGAAIAASAIPRPD